MIKTFKGGVHPKEHKELTEDYIIEECPLPDTLYISLFQHFGKPAKSIVNAGDTVEEGQLIAEADGFISAPIHAPVSGTVKKILRYPHLSGLMLETIQIERNKEATPKVWGHKNLDINKLTKEEFIKIVKEKGIVGLGGAGFPTYVKFMTKEDQHIDTILINACECEPYLNIDYRVMLEDKEKFIEALKLIKQVSEVDQIVIGIEDNKPRAIDKLSLLLKSTPDIKVQAVKTKYPQGGEKMLVKAALGREVPRGGLPLDIGVIVLNVNTILAIYDAVFCDKPILDKAITVSGLGINNPKNIRAKIGTVFAEILEFCGQMKASTKRLIVGGPMMGFAQPNDQASVIKTTSGLLCLTKEEIGDPEISPCLRCGSCVEHCPMGLVPSEISKYVEYDRIDLATEVGLLDCIECGACVFKCPSVRPIVQMVKLGKLKKRQLDAEKTKKG
ncbi:electron transport complex subunit RsxC [Candidatus Margulisiibacteriota bacterium]